MKNFLQEGKLLEMTTPVGGATKGVGYVFGGLVGVAAGSYAAAEQGIYAVEGVFEMPKLSTAVFAAGDTIFWDNTDKRWETTASGLFPAGTAVEAAGNGTTTVKVKLFGHSVVVVP